MPNGSFRDNITTWIKWQWVKLNTTVKTKMNLNYLNYLCNGAFNVKNDDYICMMWSEKGYGK